MPRNSGGTYTLPAGNPVVTATTISSVWANTTLSDIATAMTDSLSRSGDGAMLAPLELTAGTIGAPGLTWSAESTSGWYRAGAGDFRYSISAADELRVTVGGLTISHQLNVNGTSPNTFLGDITINSANPQYYLNQTTAAADNREWDITANTEGLEIRTINDAHTVTATVMRVERTGTTVDSVAFPSSSVYFSDGLVGTPSIAFGSDTNTGIYRFAADTLGIATNGVLRFAVSTTAVGATVQLQATDGSAGTPGISFGSDTDTGFYRVGADDFAAVRGASIVYQVNANGVSIASAYRLLASDGTVGSPGVQFGNDPNTGFYRDASDQIGIALGGVTAGQIIQGSFTPGWTGFSANPTGNVTYMIVGKHCFLNFTGLAAGTSNSTSMTMTGLPAVCQPTSTQVIPMEVTNNGNGMLGAFSVGASGTIAFSVMVASGSNMVPSTTGFTAASAKGCNTTSVSYSLS